MADLGLSTVALLCCIAVYSVIQVDVQAALGSSAYGNAPGGSNTGSTGSNTGSNTGSSTGTTSGTGSSNSNETGQTLGHHSGVDAAKLQKLPADFDSYTWQKKVDLLWQNIYYNKHDWNDLPTDNYTVPSFINGFTDIQNNMLPIFIDTKDYYDDARLKFVATHGTSAKVRLNINANSVYTGIFAANSILHGVMRMCITLFTPPPDYTGGFAPVLSLKFPVTGKKSENFFAGYTVEGQFPDRNYFTHELYNIFRNPIADIPYPRNITIVGFFGAINALPPPPENKPEDPLNIAVYQNCNMTQDGVVTKGPIIAPYRIQLRPNHALDIPSDSQNDFRIDLKNRIPSGTLIYTLFAQRTNASDYSQIGELRTESEMVSSEWADKALRFYHHNKRWQAQ